MPHVEQAEPKLYEEHNYFHTTSPPPLTLTCSCLKIQLIISAMLDCTWARFRHGISGCISNNIKDHRFLVQGLGLT